MIVGNGTIASVLPDRKDFIFFASGVSNARENRMSEYMREVELLELQDKSKHLVYFSSLSIFYLDELYQKHKLSMENLVRTYFKKWTIMRLGAPTWGNNPHTFLNHYRKRLENGEALESLEFKDEYRYMLDKDEFLHWINLIPEWNCEMNITGKRMKIKDAVQMYCSNTL